MGDEKTKQELKENNRKSFKKRHDIVYAEVTYIYYKFPNAQIEKGFG